MRNVAVVALAILLIVLMTSFSFGQAKFKYEPHGRRDPFIPLVDKDGNLLPEVRPLGTVEEINLEGILWDEHGESYVIISGTVLRVGELLGDYKVIKIEPKSVVLLKGAEEIIITLSSEGE